jgi:hypothetical protein
MKAEALLHSRAADTVPSPAVEAVKSTSSQACGEALNRPVGSMNGIAKIAG